MSKTMTRWMMAAVIAVAVPSFASVASAAPVSGALAIKNAMPGNLENVRYYGGGWRGGGWRGGGWGYYGGGFAAGALLGGLLAAPYYGGYYGGPYYYADPYYYSDPGYSAEPYAGGGGVDYCMRRYRTYDPNSGTFMGNDGRRHPCP